MNLRFEWDSSKATGNLAKHGIAFEEAQTVFYDPNSITIFDANHSDNEDRFIDIGMFANGHVLVVVYTETVECIRIISCRRATPRARRQYE